VFLNGQENASTFDPIAGFQMAKSDGHLFKASKFFSLVRWPTESAACLQGCFQSRSSLTRENASQRRSSLEASAVKPRIRGIKQYPSRAIDSPWHETGFAVLVNNS
jgi:hypothetical protein